MINVFRPVNTCPVENFDIESLNRDVHLKPIHSHNDYWRKRPLFDALSYGCTSIEADIWKFPKDYAVTDTTTKSTAQFKASQIYVGHNQVHLKTTNTLDTMYLDPLYRLLGSANKRFSQPMVDSQSSKFGVYFNSPESTVNLWLDLKTDGRETYAALKKSLRRFIAADYLSYFDHESGDRVEGPLTVTLTGNVPWDMLESEDDAGVQRYVFADCPLHKLKDADETERRKYARMCVFASGSLKQMVGPDEYSKSTRFGLQGRARNVLSTAFNAAHELGIRTRIWGGVDWPLSIRDGHWRILWEMGCDLINTDDLQAASDRF